MSTHHLKAINIFTDAVRQNDSEIRYVLVEFCVYNVLGSCLKLYMSIVKLFGTTANLL